jgi:hypothetical protein
MSVSFQYFIEMLSLSTQDVNLLRYALDEGD